ncbi:probable LRR receptor-like serine/threonine-protein kinase at2g16250 [Phtheirospermum japonicum]|uniref:Probable LRR receptor-like serine/threonine-protein kinase at2g16250 n=1 Tax=Phtheirospermum japonicum TaxID=374723 RepID=A0A830CHA2_9LAMI|nr:probable LRR receptor-like serine/threonine-protein kinase at2g16250 [Phtheirospermum japonicum]
MGKIFLLFLTFLFLNSVSTQSQTEFRALLDLRSSLGISAKNWHKKANPCSNWTGIKCSENGHVTRINLSGLKRTRLAKRNPQFAIESLPSFTFLSSFNSSGFLLPGSIPVWLGHGLSNLEILDLRSSSITGSIPSSVGSLSRLKYLCLSNNSITGNMPTALGNLVKLSVLDLSQNLLTGQIPKEIVSLKKNLNELDLSSNFLSGSIPSEFGSFSSLTLLNLSNNSLSGSIPGELGNLSRLVELDLGYNSLVGPLPMGLEGLTSLRRMIIGNNLLEGSFLDSPFRKLSRLEYLDVSMNNLTGNLSNVFPNVARAAVFNFSNNHFYGNLRFGPGMFRAVDMSNNYFEGPAPNASGINVTLTNNCFSGLPGQRNNEVCRNFYSDRGLSYNNGNVPRPLEPRRIRRLVYIMIGVFSGLGLIIVLTGTFLFLRSRSIRRANQESQNSNTGPARKAFTGVSFTYEQMRVATGDFRLENLIKQGHSGDLFKGTLEGGPKVVVKRVDLRSVRTNEAFMSELEFCGKVVHPRLVPLVGHCLEDENEKFLVYKYMANGDLSNALYRGVDGEEEEGVQSLDWITRLKIAIGAAEVLSYLHHECDPPLVHRDIQASSILLDDKYEVCLGSLSEVCVPGANNHQHVIARLLRSPQNSGGRSSSGSSSRSSTCAHDVYCFGKVLFELVTGKFGISSLSETGAKQWLDANLPFISIHDKELMNKIVDQSLMMDEDLLEEMWAVAIVAKSCLNPKASRRPSMRHVLKALESPFKVVRDESFSSGSRQSWTAAIFGSWHQNSSGSSNASSQTNREIIGGLRQTERVGSRGSGNHNEYSSSHKRSSSDVFPEPLEMQDVERQDSIC